MRSSRVQPAGFVMIFWSEHLIMRLPFVYVHIRSDKRHISNARWLPQPYFCFLWNKNSVSIDWVLEKQNLYKLHLKGTSSLSAIHYSWSWTF